MNAPILPTLIRGTRICEVDVSANPTGCHAGGTWPLYNDKNVHSKDDAWQGAKVNDSYTLPAYVFILA